MTLAQQALEQQAQVRSRVEDSLTLAAMTNEGLREQAEMTKSLGAGMGLLEERLASSNHKLKEFVERIMSKVEFLVRVQ